jgi:uncharacterized protein YutE (UPF0331/DUF86 family)
VKSDVIMQKFEAIKNCLKNIKDVYPASREDFLRSYVIQNSIVLDLQRAVQSSIDVGSHIVRLKKLSVPTDFKDVFEALYQNKFISKKTKEQMIKMVGFRNIAVHEYKKLDLNIIISIVENNLVDFENYMTEIFNAS